VLVISIRPKRLMESQRSACDLIYIGKNDLPFDAPNNLKVVYDFEKWVALENQMKDFPFIHFHHMFISAKRNHSF
jgi:hypothetical protein